jgi:hypothetical protein
MRIHILMLVLLLGCDSEEKLYDVSHEPASQAVIGGRYEVVGALDAYGVRQNSQAPVDYVTLIPPPGVEGPEVGFRIPISPGSTVTVRKVVRTTRFSHRMTLMVELDGTPLPAVVPVRIDMSRGNEGPSDLHLNPSIYRKLPPG